MFNGHSTFGAVALAIMQNNIGCKRVRGTRYTLGQAIETVCWQKKTLAASGANTSYVWWWFYIDGGEAAIDYDTGLTPEIHYSNGSHSYVALRGENFDPEILIRDYRSDLDNWSTAISPVETAMLKMGVQPYQRCLSAYTETFSTDYYGEVDCDTEAELLYVEPFPSNVAYLPIVLDRGFGPPPMMREFHVEGR